ncbi:MAG: NAD(P)-dependent alcohol dehydrogenase [Gammaproteobacteria bacterium]|jgi:NADPH:quinone reductase-like Zn-dependent oxidoreductase
MRAIVYRRYGPPDVLHVADVAKPVPAEDEVLIRVHAAEATKADCELRSFRFAVRWFWLPLRIRMGIRTPANPVLGGYFSGVVVAVGKAVSRFRAGEQVYGCAQLAMGAYGEYLCLPDSYTIVPGPRNLSFEEAAAVPLGGLNALHFLRLANIRAGDSVLVNGAGGSIGSFGVQIARAMGAVVTAVDSPLKAGMLGRIGADRFIDYTRQDFTQDGQQYDVIFDMVAGSSYTACIGALKPGGRYLKGNPRLGDMIRAYITTRFTDRLASVALAAETRDELLTLSTWIEDGRIRPVLDRIYPPGQAADAHRRVETEQRAGIVVLSMQEWLQ